MSEKYFGANYTALTNSVKDVDRECSGLKASDVEAESPPVLTVSEWDHAKVVGTISSTGFTLWELQVLYEETDSEGNPTDPPGHTIQARVSPPNPAEYSFTENLGHVFYLLDPNTGENVKTVDIFYDGLTEIQQWQTIAIDELDRLNFQVQRMLDWLDTTPGQLDWRELESAVEALKAQRDLIKKWREH